MAEDALEAIASRRSHEWRTAAFQGLGSSQEPFDVWFREAVMEAHGFDLSSPSPPLEQLVDHRAPLR